MFCLYNLIPLAFAFILKQTNKKLRNTTINLASIFLIKEMSLNNLHIDECSRLGKRVGWIVF